MSTAPTQEITKLSKILTDNRERIKLTLPANIDADRFNNAAINLLRRQPALATCTPSSFFGALMQAAGLGLMPGPLDHVYFVPFWNNKERKREVQLIAGYKGLTHLAHGSGKVDAVRAYIVHENDEFDYQLGLEPTVFHKPCRGLRGPSTDYYAHVKLNTGEPLIFVMSKAEVDAHRQRYSKAAKEGPWVTNFDEMALKTCIRKALKLTPLSPMIETSIGLDELAEARKGQGLTINAEQWTGLDEAQWSEEQAGEPTQEETKEAEEMAAPVLPKWGKYSEQPPAKAPTRLLVSYLNTLKKKISDPGQRSFLGENQRIVGAIEEQLKLRSAVAAEVPSDEVLQQKIFHNFGIKDLDELDWSNEETIRLFRESCKEQVPA